jgi:ATP-dependent DNA helicase RecG
MTGNVLCNSEISGDLLYLMNQIEQLAKITEQRKPVFISSLRETTVISYPKKVIMELLTNAVMHTWYGTNMPIRFYVFDDRIEVYNPGYPLDIPREERSYLAELLRRLRYARCTETGFATANNDLRYSGNKPIVLCAVDGHFMATVYRNELGGNFLGDSVV